MEINIQYIRHHAIDKVKWDHCIRKAPNGLIYAQSEYLDGMSPGWEALILGDYEYVMPLTYRKKLGIAYLFQSHFLKQLGIYGQGQIDDTLIHEFTQVAKKHFSFGDIHFNYANAGPHFLQKCNLILHLDNSFEEIQKTFRKDLITRAIKQHLIYEPGDLEEAINLCRQMAEQKNINWPLEELSKFRDLCRRLLEKNQCIIRRVISPQFKLLSAIIAPRDEKRIYGILAANTPESRSVDANAFLYNELIREFSGSGMILDFVGSEIPGVQFFFRKFTHDNQPYNVCNFNDLPDWQKKLKYFYDRWKRV